MSSAVPGPKVNYAGNSKIEKEIAAEEAATKTEPRLKKFEGVNVVQSKPTLGKRFMKSFGGQNFKAVAVAVLLEVVVPNAKDLLFDIVNEGAQRSIYGENGRRRTTSSALAQTIVSGGARVRGTNYNSISNQTRIVGGGATTATLSDRERQQFDFSNIVFESRDHAEEVLETLKNAVEDFGKVPVADFYDALEISGNGFTDQKFGWDARALNGSKVHKVREGFILLLTQPIEMD